MHLPTMMQDFPAHRAVIRECADGIPKTHMPVLTHVGLTRLAESKPRIGHGEADQGGVATNKK